METVKEYFGCNVFDDREMKANLPAKVYQSLKKTIDEGAVLDVSVANIDEAKRMELAYESAMNMANKDALTGIKNQRAYVQAEAEMDGEIDKMTPFAIIGRSSG